VEWLKDQISDSLLFYKEYDLAHSSFTKATDMTFFKEDVVQVLNRFK
jgi:hypothetical protein